MSHPASSRSASSRPVLPRGPLLGLAALLLAAAPCWSVAQSALPPPKTQGNVTYTCGGIGSPRSTAMRAEMHRHPLSMMFATPSGEFRAGVDLTIRDAAGKTVLSVPQTGPICLIDLPAGRYKVEVASDGKSRTQSVNVGGGPRSLDFHF